MNNEPVAYVNSMCNDYIDWKIEPMSIDGQPLYTHPAKESKAKDRFSNYESICLKCGITIYKPAFKTLTDEEIHLLIKDVPDYDIDTYDLMEFARAILRKAQEK
jgi:hypothetical protein